MSEEKLKIFSGCVCTSPILYNDFNAYCPNFPEKCREAQAQNIELAREHYLRKHNRIVGYASDEEYKVLRESFLDEQIDGLLRAKNRFDLKQWELEEKINND